MDLLISKNFILFKKLNRKQIRRKYSNIKCNVKQTTLQKAEFDFTAKTVPRHKVKKEGEVGCLGGARIARQKC
jgi:hypothetical protein